MKSFLKWNWKEKFQNIKEKENFIEKTTDKINKLDTEIIAYHWTGAKESIGIIDGKYTMCPVEKMIIKYQSVNTNVSVHHWREIIHGFWRRHFFEILF